MPMKKKRIYSNLNQPMASVLASFVFLGVPNELLSDIQFTVSTGKYIIPGEKRVRKLLNQEVLETEKVLWLLPSGKGEYCKGN